jgi:hypothetical protein
MAVATTSSQSEKDPARDGRVGFVQMDPTSTDSTPAHKRGTHPVYVICLGTYASAVGIL